MAIVMLHQAAHHVYVGVGEFWFDGEPVVIDDGVDMSSYGCQAGFDGALDALDVGVTLDYQSLEIDKKQVLLKDHIRLTGAYSVAVEICSGVKATVAVEIVEEQS